MKKSIIKNTLLSFILLGIGFLCYNSYPEMINKVVENRELYLENLVTYQSNISKQDSTSLEEYMNTLIDNLKDYESDFYLYNIVVQDVTATIKKNGLFISEVEVNLNAKIGKNKNITYNTVLEYKKEHDIIYKVLINKGNKDITYLTEKVIKTRDGIKFTDLTGKDVEIISNDYIIEETINPKAITILG